MKQLTFIFLSLFFFFFYNETTAQVDPNPEIDYEIIIKKETENDKSWSEGILGIENNEALISYRYGAVHEEGYHFTTIVAHLDAQGNITKKIEFSDENGVAYRIYHFGKTESNNTFLALGTKEMTEESYFLIWVLKFNKELEIEWERIIDTMCYDPSNIAPQPDKMMSEFWNNSYFLMASEHQKQDQYDQMAIYRMDQDGNLLLKKNFRHNYNDFPGSLRYISHIPGTNQFLMSNPNYYCDAYMWIMDENLERKSQISLTQELDQLCDYVDMEYINETEFIFAGRAVGMGPGNTSMGLRKGTVNKPKMKTRYWHWDRFNGFMGVHGGYFKTLALQNNYFYYVMVDNPNQYWTNNLIVAAFDHELDSLWTAYIRKDDAHYDFCSITPMTDGSCLISASRLFYYDDDTGTGDAYFVKIKTPEVLKNLAVAEHKELPAIEVYPNPTSGELRIKNYELGIGTLSEVEVEVFDIYGKKLSSNHLINTSSNHLINISGLPAGVYFLKISTDAGEVVKKIIKM